MARTKQQQVAHWALAVARDLHEYFYGDAEIMDDIVEETALVVQESVKLHGCLVLLSGEHPFNQVHLEIPRGQS